MDNNQFNFNNNNNNNNQNEKFDFDKFKNDFSSKFVKSLVIGIGIIVVLIILFNMFFFTVDEREQVVITQFNKVIRVIVDDKNDEIIELIRDNDRISDIDIVEGKGLHFKIPFIQDVRKFTDMLLTYDTSPREVITKDKKKLILDNFAQWRIKNPALFIITLKSEIGAHTRLDDIIYSKLNENIGKVDAIKIISDKDYVENMLDEMKDTINDQLMKFGIEVADIRIKRTELPTENYQNIFNRMQTERERAATEYRSEGQEEAQKIRSGADKQATILEASAYEEAERIRGEGDAEALKIYAEAYNQDAEFFAFWRSLQAYKNVFDKQTTIVLDKNTDFVKYLYQINIVSDQEQAIVDEEPIVEEESESE